MEPRRTPDSLDVVELVMAIEERLGRSLSDEETERLTSEIAERISNGEFGGADGEFGDDDLDNAVAIVVRKPGPRNPRGQAGAVALPEEPSSE